MKTFLYEKRKREKRVLITKKFGFNSQTERMEKGEEKPKSKEER